MKNFLPLCLFIVLSVSSCSNTSNTTMQPRTVENFYVTTGVEKYFLTDIPNWANFDQQAKCYRSSSIRYFDIEALMKSYSLTYNKALQIQASFNEEFEIYSKTNEAHQVTLKEEELLFYKVSEKVFNKIVFFDAPTFERINLVWLDEVIGDPKKERKLKELLSSNTMNIGVPVLVSFCLTRSEVEKKFPYSNSKMITSEMFSVYTVKGEKTPGFKIDLDQFFSKAQKIYFYSQKNIIPSDEILGNYKILNY